MNASAYVTFAKRAAHERLNEARAYLPSVNARHAPFGLNILDNGLSTFDYASSLSPRALMFARLTSENSASESALVRALLDSAIKIQRDPLNSALFVANLGERKRAGWSQAEARGALLDALLSGADS